MRTFTLRTLAPDDAAIVAMHRAAMFHEMGELAADDVDALIAASTTFLQEAITSGEYHGWLACPIGETTIVGGAGIQLRSLMPRPNPNGRGILTGQQGLILNVFVEPSCRRQGLARQLMDTVIAWAAAQELASLTLHASPAGRPLYETLYFVPTTEMRYTDRRSDVTSR